MRLSQFFVQDRRQLSVELCQPVDGPLFEFLVLKIVIQSADLTFDIEPRIPAAAVLLGVDLIADFGGLQHTVHGQGSVISWVVE